jgi:hypothetical protein
VLFALQCDDALARGTQLAERPGPPVQLHQLC